MLVLTLNSIKLLANNDRLFKNGFMIHQRKEIKSIQPSSQNGFHIKIQSDKNDIHKTSIFFYEDTGTYKYSKCTCHEQQPCRHTIAALLNILYQKDALSLDLKTNHTLKMYQSFQKVLIDQREQNYSIHLNLDITLFPVNNEEPHKLTTIGLKIGPKQLYIVKNIEKFVRSVVEQNDYELSKHYTFKHKEHRFNPTDQQIIELLYDYYETRKHLVPSTQVHVLTPTKAANLQLPSTFLTRLLLLLKDRSFQVIYDGFAFKEQQITNQVEVNYYFTEEDNGYTLSVNTYDVFFPLTEDYRFVFYNNQISILNPKASNAFRLFYKYMEEKIIEVPEESLEDFINQVLPVLELIGYVQIDPHIEERLESHPLETLIHIDRIGQQIALSIAHHYDDHIISVYPFEESEVTDIILQRNLEREYAITALLNQFDTYIMDNGRLTFKDEDNLFYFIDQGLPRLTQLAQVYYSEDFKQTYMKSQKQLITTVRYHEGLNLLDLDFSMEGVSKEELYQLLNAISLKKHYFKLSDGSFFPIDQNYSSQMNQLQQRFELNLNNPSQPILETNTYNALYIDQLLNTSVIHTDYTPTYQNLLKAIKSPTKEAYPVPKSLDSILRDYQHKGFYWLKALTQYNLGGILADDMGLGKTLQAIALIISESTGIPSLVIAPTSLIFNWEEEVHKFAPNKSTKIISGTKQEREKQINAIKRDDIVITSYGALKRDLKLYVTEFNYCIIDEAQHIKNPRSLNAQAVKAIKSKYRFALTGTPIENSLTELWSIFDFILPGYLKSHTEFVTTFERPIIKNNDHKQLEQLGLLINPFVLRRLKEDVLTELPPKIETKVTVELSKHQKKLYSAYVDQAKGELRSFEHLPKGQRSIKILSILTRLRQICCHPSLFMDNYKHDSAKMDLLVELIEESLDGGHRILVFSQFTSMLSLIQDTLTSKKIDYFYLDGSIPPIKRQQMVHDFNTGTNDIFLISLKAGGTGLNLTGADVVIHFDPWWNPAVENQATDRAYRIGQKKCVQVYKLITSGTIEEKIYQLQKRKEGLIDNVIKPGETFINKLSPKELEQLFEL